MYFKSSLQLLAFVAFHFINLVSAGDDFHTHKSFNPFLFPQHLLGSRKGHNLEGIHSVKSYLQRYGYLSNKNVEKMNANAFDDRLESAVKTYQRFFKLNESGVLDAETLHMMSQPRCGCPDVFLNENETKTSTSGDEGHLHIGNLYKFFPGKPIWKKYQYRLTYSFIRSFPSMYKEAIAQSFKEWAANSRFVFTEVNEGEWPDVKISFEVGAHGDGHPFVEGSGVLAHAFGPGDGRLHFNAAKKFSVGPVVDSYDVTSVATHEIGHVLGLGHSDIEYAIMWPSIPPNFAKAIDIDDVDGLWDLYRGFDG